MEGFWPQVDSVGFLDGIENLKEKKKNTMAWNSGSDQEYREVFEFYLA
jgi:hypothetical protein